MSQQYYYNNAQYTTPTSYAGQSVNECYGAVAPPLTSGYTSVTAGRSTIGTAYNVSGTQISSAQRSQAPVTYTYPTNATVITQPLGVVQGQQATLVAPSLSVGKLGSAGPSFVIANGPTSAHPNMPNNGAYTVTTSYFQPIPGQGQVQNQSMAQAVAVAQQANFQAAMNAANSSRGRRNVFDTRFQNFRKNPKTTPRSSVDSQVFYCDVCKISCAGPQTYREHLEGQKHKKKASGNNIVPCASTKNSQRQLRCELCDVTCTGVDAYQAHIRGTKHQKTFKLHQRLGKPIPCADPLVLKATTVAVSEANGESGTGTIKISTGPKINFINTAILKSVGVDTTVVDKALARASAEIGEEHVDLNSLQEKGVPPIGGEYIETTSNENGKVIQFNCKLCSCKFNDPHAKEMHLKGRRHRLQYKKKVDPSLVVDNKSGTSRNSKIEEERIRQKQQREEFWRRRDMQVRMREMQRLEYSNISTMGGYHDKNPRSFDTLDDRHVHAKHDSIYPGEEEMQTVQTVVVACEKALRLISEVLLDEPVATATAADPVPTTDAESTTTDVEVKKESVKVTGGEKLLSGAMRVGPLAKSVLLKGELVVSLVLLCSKWPTFALMKKVVDKLPEKLKELLPNDDTEVTLSEEYQSILVSRLKTPEMHCYIHFTSSVVREESSEGVSAVQPEDGLDRKRCLDALASLRHTKWFQAKVANYQCQTLIRVLRDLCQRVSTWAPLSSWAVELLVEKIVASEPVKMSAGSALRRFFECVASGILLPGGPGLKDPCEKDISDAAAVLSNQDREDITSSAQHALRLIAFRRIHTVLDMDALPVPGHGRVTAGVTNGRKRRHSGGNGGGAGDEIDRVDQQQKDAVSAVGLKKDKKEADDSTVESVKHESLIEETVIAKAE